MTDNIQAIDFNGVKVLKDDDTDLIRLSGITTGSAAGGRTLHDSRDDSNYQVPAGKKAHLIFLEAWHASGSPTARIISSTAVDSIAGEIVLWQPNVSTAFTDLILISSEIDENLFINQVNPNAWSLITLVFVVEENIA